MAEHALQRTMDQDAITHDITTTFDGVEVVTASGDSFFFYDPERNFDPTRRQPFATLVNRDSYDEFSRLDRDAVFRLNIGVGKATFQTQFGAQSFPSDASEVLASGYDFSALDRILPHPVYGRMFWVCVLNPSEQTFQSVRPLLAEAYALSVKRTTRANARALPVQES